MPIQSGKLMEAKDVRNNVYDVIKNIYSKLDAFSGPVNNTGLGNNFWGYGAVYSKIRQIAGENQTKDFIRKMEDLKLSVSNLSSFFEVEPGKTIYLSGFYDYAMSCYCEASYIRHAFYKVLDNTRKWNKYNTVSYLEEVPTMSAYVGNSLNAIVKDFHANWAPNDQQNLSSISMYLDKWGNANIDGYDYKLSSLATYPDFPPEDTSKSLRIGEFCYANSANKFLSILSAINIEVGNTISCLYYWWNGVTPASLRIKYYAQDNTTVLATDYCDIYDTYRISLGPGSEGVSENLKYWTDRTYGGRYDYGNTYQINYDLNLLQVTNYINDDVTIQCINRDMSHYGESDANFKTYSSIVSGYKIVDAAGQSIRIEDYGSSGGKKVVFTGLTGYSKLTFQQIDCFLNEVSGSHFCDYYLYDLNGSGSSAFHKLIHYTPIKESPVYQYATTIKNVPSLITPEDPINNVVYSSFPSNSKQHPYLTNIDGVPFDGKHEETLYEKKPLNAKKISINIDYNGTAEFVISCKFWRNPGFPLGGWGAREFFLKPQKYYSNKGGIQGIELS